MLLARLRLRRAESLRHQPSISSGSPLPTVSRKTSTTVTLFRHDMSEGLADLQQMVLDNPETVTHDSTRPRHHHRPEVGSSHVQQHHMELEELAPASCDDGLCELDWSTDPISTMEHLRQSLQDHGSAVLTIHDSRPSLLLDMVGMLHLLNQDAQTFDSSVWFHPTLVDPSPGLAVGSSSLLTLLVRQAKTPELIRRPPSCILSTPSLNMSSMATGRPFSSTRTVPDSVRHSMVTEAVQGTAQQLVEKLDIHTSCQLQCPGPKGLVIALRVLKRARKLIRKSGDYDLLIIPEILTDYDRPRICFNCWRKKLSSNQQQALHN